MRIEGVRKTNLNVTLFLLLRYMIKAYKIGKANIVYFVKIFLLCGCISLNLILLSLLSFFFSLLCCATPRPGLQIRLQIFRIRIRPSRRKRIRIRHSSKMNIRIRHQRDSHACNFVFTFVLYM